MSVPAALSTRSGKYLLRRATADDLGPIVELLAADQLGATRESAAELEPYRRAFEAIDADPAHLLLVAATPGGQVVATMQLTFIPGLARRGALRAQIEAVRVHEQHRSHGLGREIFEWAIAESSGRGCTLVQLTTDKKRSDAHRFYDRLGFEASHEGYKLRL
ncbi:GNAT family N-acetyltransferase [Saccharopolyspora sp. ASAGF58]|uniref:GNAT family N-acetyltransferase n=1 Tax=Saccharopolyspora sp. ASAGF58 TaxID=2719023 RepID=UPI001FF0DB92|nr:GNAT family N-acetyltransferase [Saccharopolyspora sp. ASAGF58]